MSQTAKSKSFRYRIEYGVIRTIFSVLKILPFRQRSKFMAWTISRVVAPLIGYRKRVHDNLDLVWSHLTTAQRDTLAKDVTRHVGHTMCELFSPQDLLAIAKNTELTGPGLVALEEARAANRPAIIVSGHFGNYDIVRAGLIARGYNVGGLYRPMNNPFFHDYYVQNISTIGAPLFERGRAGLSQMVRHLKGAGTLAVLIDIRTNSGVPLPFFGHSALTSLSMAEMALRYDAVFIPVYGTRLANGEGFTAELEEPIPHTDPETMTRAFNLSLEARIRKNPEQWFWVHNRWKGAGQPE